MNKRGCGARFCHYSTPIRIPLRGPSGEAELLMKSSRPDPPETTQDDLFGSKTDESE